MFIAGLYTPDTFKFNNASPSVFVDVVTRIPYFMNSVPFIATNACLPSLDSKSTTVPDPGVTVVPLLGIISNFIFFKSLKGETTILNVSLSNTPSARALPFSPALIMATLLTPIGSVDCSSSLEHEVNITVHRLNAHNMCVK